MSSSNFIPMLSSSPPAMGDSFDDSWAHDDDDFGDFSQAPDTPTKPPFPSTDDLPGDAFGKLATSDQTSVKQAQSDEFGGFHDPMTNDNADNFGDFAAFDNPPTDHMNNHNDAWAQFNDNKSDGMDNDGDFGDFGSFASNDSPNQGSNVVNASQEYPTEVNPTDRQNMASESPLEAGSHQESGCDDPVEFDKETLDGDDVNSDPYISFVKKSGDSSASDSPIHFKEPEISESDGVDSHDDELSDPIVGDAMGCIPDVSDCRNEVEVDGLSTFQDGGDVHSLNGNQSDKEVPDNGIVGEDGGCRNDDENGKDETVICERTVSHVELDCDPSMDEINPEVPGEVLTMSTNEVHQEKEAENTLQDSSSKSSLRTAQNNDSPNDNFEEGPKEDSSDEKLDQQNNDCIEVTNIDLDDDLADFVVAGDDNVGNDVVSNSFRASGSNENRHNALDGEIESAANSDDTAGNEFNEIASTENGATNQEDSDDFGNSPKEETNDVNFGDFSSTEPDLENVGEEFGDFNNFGSAKDESNEENFVSTELGSKNEDDDFGNFGKVDAEDANVSDFASFETGTNNEDDNFGNFDSANDENDGFGDFASTKKGTNDHDEDFGDFDNFDSSKIENEDDEFGDFSKTDVKVDEPGGNWAAFSSTTDSEKPGDWASFQESAQNDGGDFETFKSNENNETGQDEFGDFGDFEEGHSNKDDEFGDFGDFEEGHSNKDDEFGDFSSQNEESKGFLDSGTSDDNFGSFHDSHGDQLKTNNTTVKHSTSSQASRTSRVEQLIGASFSGSFTLREVINDNCFLSIMDISENQEKNKETNNRWLPLWTDLCDIEQTIALKYSWHESKHKKELLNSLHIDRRNLLVGHKKQSVPIFASGLGLLQPTKGPKDSKHDPVPTLIDTQKVEQPQENNLPPVEFDWSGSGLTNPLDSKPSNLRQKDSQCNALLDLDFFSSNDNYSPLESKPSELESEFLTSVPTSAPAPTKTLQPLESLLSKFTPTMSTIPKTNKDKQQLSDEASRIVSRFPNLSFMKSNVLMFPLKAETN